MYAQLGQQPLVRTTETSLELNPLSCLSARPPDLARVVSKLSSQYCTIYIDEYEEDRLYVYLWVPTSVGSRPSATSLRGDGKGSPSEPSPGGGE